MKPEQGEDPPECKLLEGRSQETSNLCSYFSVEPENGLVCFKFAHRFIEKIPWEQKSAK